MLIKKIDDAAEDIWWLEIDYLTAIKVAVNYDALNKYKWNEFIFRRKKTPAVYRSFFEHHKLEKSNDKI